MATYIVIGSQMRRPGRKEVLRRFVVSAPSRIEALVIAHKYANGYFQCGPLYGTSVIEIPEGCIESFDAFGE